MNCRRVEPLLSKHLEGLLPAREAQKVASHLAECRTCRRLRDELAALAAELRELPRLPLSPETPRRIAGTWMAERETTTPRWRRGFLALSPPTPSLWPLLAAAALVVLALTLAWWGHGKANEVSSFHVAQRPPRDRMTPAPSALPPRVSQTDRRFARAHSAPPNASPRSQPSLRPDAAGSAEKKRGRQPSKPMGVDLARHDRDPLVNAAGWSPAPTDAWDTVERRVRRAVPVRDDFVQIAFPRIASISDRQMAAAIESYKREADIVDPRLSREVTLQQKSTALLDLCERLRADTGIQLGAGPSVADEKVTLFCEKLPLRDVMRQLSRPFGYTWLRSGRAGEYKYELVQDLRSQLLEEELRNRDRNAALIALGREIERYRPYLGLSPDEALARSKTAPPAEKPLLEKLSALGWGPIQMYFRLSRNDLEALRTGKELQFVAGDLRSIIGIDLGDRPLPPDVARGVLQSLREWRIRKLDPAYLGVAMDPPEDKGPSFGLWFSAKDAPDAPPPAAVPEANALVTLSLQQSELGQFTLSGASGLYTSRNGKHTGIFVRSSSGPCASGVSRRVQQPENAALNAKLAGDPDLQRKVTVRPEPSCSTAPSPAPTNANSTAATGASLPEAKVTMADLYEALYRATGLPIVADQYTRLYRPEEVMMRNRRLFDALSSLADTMRTRWSKDGTWLQFRSLSYYDDRLKEVPNRLLNRWASAKREHGLLTLDEIVEIAQLADAQLDGQEMAEGARDCFGLKEWNLARGGLLRSELRYLAQFTPEQRQEMQRPTGLLLSRMSLTQQQGFISRLRSPSPIGSMEELAGATLRVEYTQPGWFTWRMPGSWTRRWVFPLEPGSNGRRALMPSIRERTRDAALQAARRLAPQASEAVLSLMRRADPQFDPSQLAPQPDQIVATDLDLNVVYIPGTLNKHFIVQNGPNGNLIDPAL